MIGLRVLTVGTFDSLHVGHLNLLDRCRRLACLSFPDLPYIGVNSDRFVEKYKGRVPACSENERMQAVSPYGFPAINDGPGYALIREIKPDFLVVGSDWLEKGYLEQIGMTPEELFEELGVSLVFVPRTPGVSSSGLRA